MVVAEGTELDLNRVTVVGHSAGGHLALWSAARTDKRGTLRVPTHVRPAAAAGLAAVVDLARAHALSVGNSAVGELLEGSPDQQPIRYAAASPIALLPLGVKQLIVHGVADEALPIEVTRNYVQAARAAGDTIQFSELPDAGHMDCLDPCSKGHMTLCRWLGQSTNTVEVP
jgi:acetyl esterase/lipase